MTIFLFKRLFRGSMFVLFPLGTSQNASVDERHLAKQVDVGNNISSKRIWVVVVATGEYIPRDMNSSISHSTVNKLASLGLKMPQAKNNEQTPLLV